MSGDLHSQLAEYGTQIREGQSVLTVDDVVWRSESAVIGAGRVGMPTRRLRPGLVVTAAFLMVLLIGLFQLLLAGDDPQVADTAPVAPRPDLGVFEPIRGWIVYPFGVHLEAVDPADPSARHTLDLLPGAWGAQPAGWSSDGSLLALSNEDADAWLVVDSRGEIAVKLRDPGGCCVPMTSPWLSPDGAFAAMGLRIIDLNDSESVQSTFRSDDLSLIGADPPLEKAAESIGGFEVFGAVAWSPDGSEVAITAEREGDWTVQIIDRETGVPREVVGPGFGEIWHLAWSPNGSKLLVTASEDTVTEMFPQYDPNSNPLMFERWPSNLYVVDLDSTYIQAIATGHYLATTWSPDGTRIAAIDNRSNGKAIVLMNADGTGQSVLPDVVPGGDFTGIAWHPVP